MDSTTAVIIIVVIFAIVVLAALWRYRRQGEASIEVGGARVHVKGENDPTPAKAGAEPSAQVAGGSSQPGVNVRDAKSGGGIMAEDKTGRGVNIERVETEDDILASSENPPDPKA